MWSAGGPGKEETVSLDEVEGPILAVIAGMTHRGAT
jgi:hypothetical protein